MLSFLLLVLGLVMIVYGANILVDGAAAVAKKYQISNIVIGLTVVAFGTSAPELAVSSYAAVSGNSEIAIGNVVGSNICNILLILGITSIIYPLDILKNTVLKEIPLSLLAAIVLYIMVNDKLLGNGESNILSMSDGFILLSFLVIFMYYLTHLAKTSTEEDDIVILNMPKYKSLLFILGGLVLLVVGGKVFVDHASELAIEMGMSKAVVGLTIVALGTSMPELATSIVAALKKNTDIAVGNVIGSNIFNVFLVLGVGSVISPLQRGSISDIDLYVCILASIALLIASYILGRNRITKWEGIAFVTMYAVYMGYQVGQV
jgi:cation:H+ antiporter